MNFFKKHQEKNNNLIEPTEIKDSEKFFRKGSTEIISKKDIIESKGNCFFGPAAPIMKLPKDWDYETLIRRREDNFTSYDVAGYDSTWGQAAHLNFYEDEKNPNCPSKIVITAPRKPDGSIDFTRYFGKGQNFADTLLMAYESLTNKVITIQKLNTERANELQKENETQDTRTPEEKAEDENSHNYWVRYNLCSECLNLIKYSFKLNELGLYDVDNNPLGKEREEKVEFCFVTDINDVENVINPDFTEYKPSSLAELNCALNRYHSGLADIKILRAFSKKLDEIYQERELEIQYLKEIINS